MNSWSGTTVTSMGSSRTTCLFSIDNECAVRYRNLNANVRFGVERAMGMG